jgi:hypothetical protein
MLRPGVQPPVEVIVPQVPGLQGVNELATAGAGDPARAHLHVERLAKLLVVPAVAPGDPGGDPRGVEGAGGYGDAAGCRRARA